MNLFNSAVNKKNVKRPPVWFMRQAGRYHSHYQEYRKRYSFMELCKLPEVACEVTMGPIQDFDFDAAILFSDLLFPLEVMGMGLTYDEGPKLGYHLKEIADLKKLHSGAHLAEGIQFQAEAMKLIRKKLPAEKGLLGFVGGPLTLYCYAVEGSHQGNLNSAKQGLIDGRYSGFYEKLFDLLVENMVLQARAGADAIAVLDTCAGEFDVQSYSKHVVPTLKPLLEKFKEKCPNTPIVYYSKGTGPAYWEYLSQLPIQALGVDWKHDISQVLSNWGERWAIQGNIDPQWLFLEPAELERRLRAVFESVARLPLQKRQGWVCGLGHGVLPKTPEQNVKLFLRIQKEIFSGELK
jgi:uroporphyrinogen decarboxylase